MENNPPNSSQNPQTSAPAPKMPETPNEKEKIGSLVERLRSYESDIARLKGVSLKPEAKPEWNFEQELPHKPFEIAGKPEVSVKNPGVTLKTLEAANVAPEPEKPKQNPQEAIDALHKDVPIQQARTIQTDIIDHSKIKETSIADIIRAEEEKNRVQPKEITDPKRSIYILSLSAILIFAGLVSVYIFYTIKTAPSPKPPTIENPNSIIEVKSSREVILSSDQSLMEALISVKKSPVGATGDIVGINLKEGTSTPLNGSRFARLFSDTMPAWLVRSFKPQYLVGMYSLSGTWQPFMIFKLTSYDTAYSGMLEWEETMQNDFSRFVSNGGSISSASSTNPVIKTSFRDTIIKNKDVRVLEDTLGRRLILYSFTDKDTLVITTNQAVLEAIFARLTTSKFVQ